MIDLLTRKKYYIHSDEIKKNRNFAFAKIVKIIVVDASVGAKAKKYD